MSDNEEKTSVLQACLGKSQNLANLVEYSMNSIVSKTILDKPDLLSYHLLSGLTEAIDACFWLHKGLPAKKLVIKPLSLSYKRVDIFRKH